MHDVAVLTNTGIPLMPTTRKRARTLLKNGKAVIERYRPVFTIRLTNRSKGETQPMELKVDTGYRNIGISVCCTKREHLSREYRLLPDETKQHMDRKKYRRSRRNRLRYRKPRFDNRRGKICEDGFAPSIRNTRDRHIDLVKAICDVMPVRDAYIEMGQFDTQVLKAIEEGRPLPQGTDYQHGERYGFATLREAVFARDNYTCICCGKNAQKDGVILRVHHLGYLQNDRTNRLSNLAAVCDKCHSPKNHQPGGKLHGLKPKLKSFKGATFMTMVRWNMWQRMKEACPNVTFHITYGAATKLARAELGVEKSHANDAYVMGTLHPKQRAKTQYFQKRRRNNRVLEKFYDAAYTDVRDGKTKKAAELGCNRTRRRILRNNPENRRMYRATKIKKGRRRIRRTRYALQPGTVVRTPDGIRIVKGVVSNGKSVLFRDGKSVSPAKCEVLRYATTWVQLT